MILVKKPFVLGFIPLLFSISLVAQTTQNVQIFVYPNIGIIKLDTLIIDLTGKQQPIEIQLPEGEYTLEGWAPRMEQKQVDFVVKADTINRVRLRLSKAAAYTAYRKKLTKYRVKRVASYVSLGASVGVTMFTFSPQLRKDYDLVRESMGELKLSYEAAVSPDNIAESAARYNQELELYEDTVKKVRNRKIIGIPLMLASYGLTYYSFYKTSKKRLKKPEYEIKNPLLSAIEIHPDFSQTLIGSTNGLSLKIKF